MSDSTSRLVAYPSRPHVSRSRASLGRRSTTALLALSTAVVMTVVGAAGPAAAANPAPASSSHVLTAPTQRGAGTEAYVRAVYRDLFDRSVDPSGLRTWVAALESGTPRTATANAITSSAEYRSRLVTEAYSTYLNRAPDAQGLRTWVAAMSRGLQIQSMEAGFISSPEYIAKAGSPSAWVTRLYRDVLHRSPARAEVTHWVEQLRSGASPNSIARGFLYSNEHLSTVIDGHYQHLLGRSLDAAGRSTWVRAIQGGMRIEAVIGGIVASPEYASKNGAVQDAPRPPQTGTPRTSAPPTSTPPPDPKPAPATPPVPPATAPTPPPAPPVTSDPGSAGFPDASTTGPRSGHVLRPSGSLTISQDGAVVSDLAINGCIDVRAKNVTITDVYISCSRPATAIRIHDGASATVRYTEIHGNGVVSTAVGFSNYTLEHVNIHDVIDGPRVNFNVKILDSYIHSLTRTEGSHNDALQTTGGTGIVIRGNRLEAYNASTNDPMNAAIMIGSENAPLRDMVVEGNYLDGGNYTILAREDLDGSGVVVRDNVFTTNYRYGAYRGAQGMTADHTNRFVDGGKSIFG